jgi:hypothetical protein
MSAAGEATEVDAEALNSENVYWIDYRKDRHFIGSELRNGRFKVNQFVHASEVSSVGLVWEGRDKKKGNMRVAIKTPKAPATPSDWPSNWLLPAHAAARVLPPEVWQWEHCSHPGTFLNVPFLRDPGRATGRPGRCRRGG